MTAPWPAPPPAPQPHPPGGPHPSVCDWVPLLRALRAAGYDRTAFGSWYSAQWLWRRHDVVIEAELHPDHIFVTVDDRIPCSDPARNPRRRLRASATLTGPAAAAEWLSAWGVLPSPTERAA
jgi:hypothetical protein